MGVGRKDIVNNIFSNTQLSLIDSKKILNSFINIFKKNKNIKISNFGSFLLVDTPKRVGRNPKTKEEYVIKPRKKLSFKASHKVKSFLN